MKQNTHSRLTPAAPATPATPATPADHNSLCNFARVPRHRPRIVYVVQGLTPATVTAAGVVVDEAASTVTSSSVTALRLLGEACLVGQAQTPQRTPVLVAHVEYSLNRFAEHPKPENFRVVFNLAEFAAHHAGWKEDVTHYPIG